MKWFRRRKAKAQDVQPQVPLTEEQIVRRQAQEAQALLSTANAFLLDAMTKCPAYRDVVERIAGLTRQLVDCHHLLNDAPPPVRPPVVMRGDNNLLFATDAQVVLIEEGWESPADAWKDASDILQRSVTMETITRAEAGRVIGELKRRRAQQDEIERQSRVVVVPPMPEAAPAPALAPVEVPPMPEAAITKPVADIVMTAEQMADPDTLLTEPSNLVYQSQPAHAMLQNDPEPEELDSGVEQINDGPDLTPRTPTVEDLLADEGVQASTYRAVMAEMPNHATTNATIHAVALQQGRPFGSVQSNFYTHRRKLSDLGHATVETFAAAPKPEQEPDPEPESHSEMVFRMVEARVSRLGSQKAAISDVARELDRPFQGTRTAYYAERQRRFGTRQPENTEDLPERMTPSADWDADTIIEYIRIETAHGILQREMSDAMNAAGLVTLTKGVPWSQSVISSFEKSVYQNRAVDQMRELVPDSAPPVSSWDDERLANWIETLVARHDWTNGQVAQLLNQRGLRTKRGRLYRAPSIAFLRRQVKEERQARNTVKLTGELLSDAADQLAQA